MKDLEPRRFFVDTSVGKLCVYAAADSNGKRNSDSVTDFPGVYVELIKEGHQESILLAVIEQSDKEKQLQCCVYPTFDLDEPKVTLFEEEEQ